MIARLVSHRHHCASAIAVASGLVLVTVMLRAEPVTVRHLEGVAHGFLVLRTLEGTTLADGDLTQVASGARVTTRVIFHFKDGSSQDETAVFSQEGRFRLVSDRLVQSGPSFPRPLEMSIDPPRGVVTVRYSDDGEWKEETRRMSLPEDLANGLVPTLLKNVDGSEPPKSFSYVAATPTPRLVRLSLSSVGPERFAADGRARAAAHYVLHPEIGGITGLFAGLLGKQPPDSHVWILGGDAPTFVKSEQPLYVGGPVWRIELAAPTSQQGDAGRD